jgi:hypothetical protein
MSEQALAEAKTGQNDFRPVVDVYAEEQTKLDAEYAQKAAKLAREKAFGVRNQVEGPLLEDGRPIAGSHADYHSQRPSEGIIRDGNDFRRTGGQKGGQFVGEAEYNAQNGVSHVNASILTEKNSNPQSWTYHDDEETSANRYYDKLIGGDKQQEAAPETRYEDYENMNVHELALASAKANLVTDKKEADKIHGVVEALLMEAALSKDSEMAESDYQKEIERFDHLVELAIKQQEASNPESAAINKIIAKNNRRAEAKAKGEPFNEDEDATTTPPDLDPITDPEPGTNPDPEPQPGQNSGTETDPEPVKAETTVHNPGDDAEVNGEKVELGQKLVGADGLVAYEVTKPDGSRTLVYENELTFPEPAEEKESIAERAKSFWNKSRGFIAQKFTMGYMKTQWFINDSIINRGIDPLTTSFEEAEKIRHRRRIALVAGAAATLVLLALTKDVVGIHGGGGGHVADLPLGGGHAPTPSPSDSDSQHLSNGSEFLQPQGPSRPPELNPNDPAFTLTPVEQAPAPLTPDTLSLSDPAFNIEGGEGGLQLFDQLHIDPGKWADNAARLLREHPEDFRLAPNGSSVWISHSGELSEATRLDLIKIKQG